MTSNACARHEHADCFGYLCECACHRPDLSPARLAWCALLVVLVTMLATTLVVR